MDFQDRLRLHRIAIALLVGALIAISSAYIKQGRALRLLRNHHELEHVEWNMERERLESQIQDGQPTQAESSSSSVTLTLQ
jgi:hypothetical protein